MRSPAIVSSPRAASADNQRAQAESPSDLKRSDSVNDKDKRESEESQSEDEAGDAAQQPEGDGPAAAERASRRKEEDQAPRERKQNLETERDLHAPTSVAPPSSEPQERLEPQSTEEEKPARPATARSATASATTSRRPFVPLTPKSWRLRAMQSNSQLTRLMKAALLQTLLHALRCGSVEGVKVAIERGVQVQYLDSRQRNLIMLATKCDTDARLQIVIILSDAGCDINHADQLGWSCLHYACASGAIDVAAELIRRGARVEFNPYGYGPEDFLIPKVARAKSLLQHTEQLQHEQSVCASWGFFRRHAEKAGYSVKCKSNCDLGKPLKLTFQAPADHSALDRIRVVDMNSDVALWLQVSKTFSIPPGGVGTITLDAETLDRPSLYRLFYEKYEPTPLQLPAAVAEKSLCVKNLDTGTTVSMGSVNKLVLQELQSTRTSRKTKHLSSSSRQAPDSGKPTSVARRMSTTRCREIAEAEREAAAEDAGVDDQEDDADFSADETVTMTEVAEHPAVTSITGVYKTVAMSSVSVSTLKSAKANEYEIVVARAGPLGLNLEAKLVGARRSTRLIVRRSQGQSAAVNPGDSLVAIGNANIEHAGLKHTLWELKDAKRPLVLRFRRGNATEKKSLFKAGLSKLAGPRRHASIAV